MKRCFKCGKRKALSAFYQHSAMGDGLLGKCKECTKADVKANYRSKISQYKDYERARAQLPARRVAILEYQRTRRSKFPDKYKARTAVGNALRDGRLERQPCAKCGSDETQAHHDDYSRPLDVRWLCFTCHRKEHGQYAYEEATA